MSDALKKKIDAAEKIKRDWETEFQKWINRKFANCEYPFGYCDKGAICDGCPCVRHGRPSVGVPCVKALNKMSQREPIFIDHRDTSEACFEDAWYGKSELERYKKLLYAAHDLKVCYGFFGKRDVEAFKKIMKRDGFEDLSLYKRYLLDNIKRLAGEEDWTVKYVYSPMVK